VSDSPTERAFSAALDRQQRALEALGKAAQSGSPEELAAAFEEWEASKPDITHWGVLRAAEIAAELLLRPPTGEVPPHE
jgi:hypothetical protein